MSICFCLQVLEFQAQQRLWALQQEELAAAGTSALRDAASTQASALAAQVQHQAAEWQVQDEARALKRQHELARKARLAAAAEQEAALQAAKGVLLTQELQAQEELAKVCRALNGHRHHHVPLWFATWAALCKQPAAELIPANDDTHTVRIFAVHDLHAGAAPASAQAAGRG